jgi:ribosome-binding protein aMBF1 (putative translation factor)
VTDEPKQCLTQLKVAENPLERSLDARVGRRICVRRTHSGLEIEELAQKIGLPSAYLTAMEAGCYRATPELLSAIAYCLGVQAAWFFVDPKPSSNQG